MIVSLGIGSAAATWSAEKSSAPNHTQPPEVKVVHLQGLDPGKPLDQLVYEEQLKAYQHDLELIQYNHDVELIQYQKDLDAQRAQQVVRSTPTPSAPVVVSHGAHSDTWWQGVSVCEQGGRNDGYFGYFSIMDGSAGGKDWSTQVGMANAIISRAGEGAWAASCVAAGYRSSPGG
jgi:hypothetical protein